MSSPSIRFSAIAGSVVLAFAAAQGTAWAAPQGEADAGQLSGAAPAVDPQDSAPPAVELSPNLLYRILKAELLAQRDEYEPAARALLDLARETRDFRLARRAFQMAMTAHDTGLALRAAREWANLDPENPEAVAASLALAASSGQTDGLARTLARRIRHAQDKDQAIVQAAGIVSKMVDTRLALDVLDKALAATLDTSALAHLALADAAWAAGDPKRALAESRQALAMQPDSGEAAQRILEYGLRVDPVRAVQETQDYIAAHPGQRGLQLLLVGRLTAHGDFDQALGVLDQMRHRNPEDFDLLYTEAEVNVRANRFTAARTLLDEYISIQKQRRRAIADGATSAQADVSDARLLLVSMAEKEQDYKGAIQQLRLIDEPSLQFQVRLHEATLLGKMGDLSAAREKLDAIRPADHRERIVVQLTLASIYRTAGRTDQAVELLKSADLEMPDTPEIKYDLGMLLHQQGDAEGFERMMRAVIALDPNNANAYNSLGYTYVEQNRKLDDARDLLEQALDLEPNNPFILDSVGWYLFRIDDAQGALEYLRRSYDRMPAADVAAHLGEVLWQLGRKNEARRIWTEGLENDPDNESVRATLKRLGVRL